MNLHNTVCPILGNADSPQLLIINSLITCRIPASVLPGLIRASVILSIAY